MQELHIQPYILAEKVLCKYKEARKRIVTAESCTGGLLSAALTSVAGSSKVFDRGYITYSNESKIELLDVNEQLISNYGAVSREVSIAMAEGALKKLSAFKNRDVNKRKGCNVAISITGIAEPVMVENGKRLGLVFITCIDSNKKIVTQKYNFAGNRNEIRNKTVYSALELLLSV